LSEVVRGIIRSFDAATYLADVEPVGYPASVLRAVPVAWDIDETHPADGVECLVLLMDGLNAGRAVVVGLFGGPPT